MHANQQGCMGNGKVLQCSLVVKGEDDRHTWQRFSVIWHKAYFCPRHVLRTWKMPVLKHNIQGKGIHGNSLCGSLVNQQ